MPIIWTQELNTGIRIIDLQHQELVDMINDLEHLIDAKSTLSALRPVLLRLQNYVLFHFSHEEGLMQRKHIDAEHLKAHFAEHKGFADEVARAIDALAESATPDTSGLHSYLKTWLVNHIMGTDKKVAAQLRN